jgi:uncharacterized membrane protein YfcA
MLLLAFVAGVFLTVGFALGDIIAGMGQISGRQEAIYAGSVASVSGLVGASAAWAHWRRFKVPITIAAGTAATAAIVAGIVIAILGDVEGNANFLWTVMLLIGVGVFLFAMRWDASDPGRTTRRSDVAFWLHLLAAPLIVHPIFTLLGLNDGTGGIGEGVVVILLYAAMGVTALAIDRRALLVSALAYVLWALNNMFEQFGAVELNIALTALVIGSALLLLSAYWHQARRAIVNQLPDTLRSKLPLIDRPISPAPAA